MPKSLEEITQIGEKILVANGSIKLGTKAGYLDKMLGEKDVRRIVIDGNNVDSQSNEYKEFCKKAYNKFRKKFRDEEGVIDKTAFNEALGKVDKIYNSNLEEAEKNDNVNWSSVALNSLMLGDNFANKQK